MKSNWRESLSKPKFKIRGEKGVRIPLRDGIHLAADINYPDSKGKFPALLSISPYGKDVQELKSPTAPPSALIGNGGQEAGNTEFFVSRGYVHVIVDTRGSGDSEGEYPFYGPQEHEDGYDVVEWIAAQPWCNGNVGMLGISYFGVIQLAIAAQNPPHLKAIAPYDAYTDRYRDIFYHGGILNVGFYLQWWGHVSVGSSLPRSLRENPEKARKIAELLMEQEEIRSHPTLFITLKYPEKNIPLFEGLTHPLDGPFYWESSSYTKLDSIKTPCFMIGRWSAWQYHLPGAFSAYNGIDAPKKLMVMESKYPTGPLRPWNDDHDILLRWYDHWLKGNDTGMMDEPPITLFIKGRDEWRSENEWPLARTQWKKLYLGKGQTLKETPENGGEQSDAFFNMSTLLPGEAIPGITYRTPPLDKDVEVTGPLSLYLHASLDQSEATWFVYIKDVSKDGTAQVITMGWLKASHRALDAERSKPYQPYHPHTESIPVNPGEILEYAIGIRECSFVFKAGHRIELEIRGQDSPFENPRWYHLGNMKKTKHKICHNREHQSYLLIPIIPDS